MVTKAPQNITPPLTNTKRVPARIAVELESSYFETTSGVRISFPEISRGFRELSSCGVDGIGGGAWRPVGGPEAGQSSRGIGGHGRTVAFVARLPFGVFAAVS